MSPGDFSKLAIEWVVNVGVVVLIGITLVSVLGSWLVRTIKRIRDEWWE